MEMVRMSGFASDETDECHACRRAEVAPIKYLVSEFVIRTGHSQENKILSYTGRVNLGEFPVFTRYYLMGHLKGATSEELRD